jgi:thioesterase DpgC
MAFVRTAELDAELACLRDGYARLAALPPRPVRDAAQQALAVALLADGRARREGLLGAHAPAVYAELTDGLRRELRVTDLLYASAERFPGLVPARQQVADELARPQAEKDGLEVDQGLFAAHVLADPRSGTHLLGAMSRPRPESAAVVAAMRCTDALDLGPVGIRRAGTLGYVTLQNHRTLNAEDDATVAALEVAVDWVLLDDRVEAGVLRGGPSTHPRWAGRRVFGSGVDLTALHQGRISLAGFFLERELGAVDKMYRGHTLGAARGQAPGAADDLSPRREKPWIAAVEAFAIGGACQFLLVMDWVIAAAGSYFTLPANREGIVPGCGPLRLPRFVGEARAREVLLCGGPLYTDGPDAGLLARAVVAPGAMDRAITDAAETLLGGGLTAVRANRRALRVAVEPLDHFRRYMAAYAREQAYCLHDPRLVANLERTWIRRDR